ncbi:MAG: acyl-CoA/acyl-ACP dehydrogenase [Firmicutes bacterium]|nr:acyl-CoA/acyl-ACP dehydrogenase [Bacillota bacterium]
MDFTVKTARERAVATEARGLAGRIAQAGLVADRDAQFTADAIRTLQAAGYGGLTAPVEYGGQGATITELVLAQEALGEADPSAGLVFGWHLGLLLSLRETRTWPEARYADLCREAVAGRALINACRSEPETGSPSRGGRPTTTAERVDGGYVVTGRKTWATGGPALTHILISAGVDGSAAVGEFLVRAGSSGLSLDLTWDSLSLRGSGSHTIVMDHVFVPDDDVCSITEPGQRPARGGANAGLLHIPGLYMGVANAARRFTIEHARSYAPNSLGGKTIATVPAVRERLGRIEVLRTSARLLLYDVARQADACPVQERGQLRHLLGLAKLQVTNAAVEIVDLCMRIVGGDSLLRSLPLERCYRDVRAGLHNPPMDDMTVQQLADAALAEDFL